MTVGAVDTAKTVADWIDKLLVKQLQAELIRVAAGEYWARQAGAGEGVARASILRAWTEFP